MNICGNGICVCDNYEYPETACAESRQVMISNPGDFNPRYYWDHSRNVVLSVLPSEMESGTRYYIDPDLVTEAPDSPRVGPLGSRRELIAFFKTHRPLPYSTGHPEERSSWYACTCDEWASKKTRASAELHHMLQFEEHMTEALIALGWRRTTK
jgi:hypothetical protein